MATIDLIVFGNVETGILECIRYSETGGIPQHFKVGKNQYTIYL